MGSIGFGQLGRCPLGSIVFDQFGSLPFSSTDFGFQTAGTKATFGYNFLDKDYFTPENGFPIIDKINYQYEYIIVIFSGPLWAARLQGRQMARPRQEHH